MPKHGVALLAGLAAALLFALPAVAQTAPPTEGVAPAEGVTPTPGVTDNGTAIPATPPPLQSPALGPLEGRDAPLIFGPPAGGTLGGFATTAPGLGLAGGGTPFDLGNRPYAIRPSIGIGILATNNLFQTGQNPQSDVVTSIAPSLDAAVATPRLFGQLRYAPVARIYAINSNQDGIDQIGDGKLLAAVVPGLLYVDVRGAANVLSIAPGQIPGSGQFVAGSNTAQTYNAQITPFLVHRFGSTATAQAGYSLQYSQQTWATFNNVNTDNVAANFIANRGFAVIRSGEDLGRLALQGRIDGTWYAGNGIYTDAHRFIATVGARYAILPSVAVLGEIGYENQQYAGTNPLSIDEPTWSVGVRLTPKPDSIVIIRYGRRSGFNSLSVNAGVALGPRTQLFAIYRDTLNTSLTEAQDLLATTTNDAFGNLVDSQSGAPVVLINSFLGLTDTLYRMRTGTMALRYRWPRDVFTLSGTWQAQDPITSALNSAPASSSNGIYGALNWAHEFSPRTIGGAQVQYGHVNYGQPGASESDIFALSATLTHRLNEKLTAGMQATWSTNVSSLAGQSYTQGVIRIGLRRTF